MEIIGGVHDEAASIDDSKLFCCSPAAFDQVCGNVAEDHAAARPDPIERPEADQPIPTTDIEDDVAGLECGAVEDAIASLLQLLNQVGR